MNNNTERSKATLSSRVRRIAAVAFLLIAFAFAAHPQQGGVTVVAPNGRSVSVPVLITPGLGDIARGGNGLVMVDPRLLGMPWEFQQAVLAHEAAHAIGIVNETAADHFAGQMLRIAGFGPNQMRIVFASMGAFLGRWGDATHLPSDARIQVVLAGYNGQ